MLRRLILFTMLVSLAIAGETESAPSTRSLMRFANEMTFAALKEGKGTVSLAALCEHATAMMKYLEGEPKPEEKLRVRPDLGPTEMKEDEISVVVGYDNGLTGRGYRFTYQKKMGFLKSITVVLGE